MNVYKGKTVLITSASTTDGLVNLTYPIFHPKSPKRHNS